MPRGSSTSLSKVHKLPRNLRLALGQHRVLPRKQDLSIFQSARIDMSSVSVQAVRLSSGKRYLGLKVIQSKLLETKTRGSSA